MTVREAAFLFECEGDELVGIIAAPEEISSDLGILVVVGGPQYRVGSHRQFVLMARRLAENGFACMRFDYRGMGDATGEQRDFEHVEQDIRAAIDAFCARAPAVKRVVLWGLCDGASAACFYAASDMRVAGMVLLNPWVKTAAGEAKTYLKHYYLQRVLEPAFWKKLMGGGVSIGKSLRGLFTAVEVASSKADVTSDGVAKGDLPQRMAAGLVRAGKPFCVVLSERDYVAREFESVVAAGGAWKGLTAATSPTRIAKSDHTFSTAEWRALVEDCTKAWVSALGRGQPKEKL